MEAGTADRWSDLEIDCYWTRAPSEQERRFPIDAVGAHDVVVWAYDEDEQEWSEDYQLDGLSITISNLTLQTIEEILDAVLVGLDTDPVKQMRMAAIQSSVALRGEPPLAAWGTRCDLFPEPLVGALIAKSLNEMPLTGWAIRDALVQRGDLIALSQLLVDIEAVILSTVAALNRIYRSHRLPKWQRTVLGRCRIAPARLGQRLDCIWRLPPHCRSCRGRDAAARNRRAARRERARGSQRL